MKEKKKLEKEIIYVPVPEMNQEDEIDLLEIWKVIWRGKWFIIGFTLCCTLVAVYVTLYVLPVTYQSNAVLQPTESGNDHSSRFSTLAANLPFPVNLPGGGDKSMSIVAFLNSRTLKLRLIQEHNLLPVLYRKLWDAEKEKWKVDDPEDIPSDISAIQLGKLKNIFRVEQDDKTSLMTISWVDEDPEFCSIMLGHIIDKLNFYLENEYESDAKKERIFVEKQLVTAERDLDYWEKQIPSRQLTLSKIQRERLASQTVYTELRKQLELAKISEVKEIVRFKVLDKPFVPEKKYKPQRSFICAFVIVLSGCFSMLIVFLWRLMVNSRKDKTCSVQ